MQPSRIVSHLNVYLSLFSSFLNFMCREQTRISVTDQPQHNRWSGRCGFFRKRCHSHYWWNNSLVCGIYIGRSKGPLYRSQWQTLVQARSDQGTLSILANARNHDSLVLLVRIQLGLGLVARYRPARRCGSASGRQYDIGGSIRHHLRTIFSCIYHRTPHWRVYLGYVHGHEWMVSIVCFVREYITS